MSKIVINAEYCGPPGLGNGGYVAGTLAKNVDYDCEVMLKGPTPLDTELNLLKTKEGLDLFDGVQIIASATKSSIGMVPPRPISFAQAEKASENFIGHDGQHPYPNCFVCGPARPNGLRIFAGRIDDTDHYGAPWIPNEHLTDTEDQVCEEYIWAALDCPGAFAIWGDQPAATLLGKIKAKIIRRPKAYQRCIIQAWHIESQGRKHRCGTAIHDEQGSLLACADALWISPRI